MSKKSNKKASDKFEIVAQRLLSLLEQGKKPWIKPWKSVGYQNLVTRHPYAGINPLLCEVDMMSKGYESPYFVGFNQVKENNWLIKKGSEATWLRWGGSYSFEVEEEGEKTTKTGYSSKWLNVFNIDCVDDTKAEKKLQSYVDKILVPTQLVATDEVVERFINSQGAKINHGGDRAFYSPESDQITLPHVKQFTRLSAYYATAIHELGHWTGHRDRLNRDLSGSFGSENYAFEELIAEVTASFIMNEYGYQGEMEHHASYLSSWIARIKSDNKAFFKAASAATKASEFLLVTQAKATEIAA